MSQEKMFVIIVRGGEYSDSWQEEICLVRSEEQAECLVTKANDIIAWHGTECTKIHDEYRAVMTDENGVRIFPKKSQECPHTTKKVASMQFVSDVAMADLKVLFYPVTPSFHIVEAEFLWLELCVLEPK